jgi:hypothetical protein
MAITLRQTKGTGLTYAEADENWAYLERTKHNRLDVSYEGEYLKPKIIVNSDGEIIAVEEQVIGGNDLVGSVFADDSSVMVDSIDHKLYGANGIYGNLEGNVLGDLVGNVRGSVFADDSSLIIDGISGTVAASAIVGTLTGVSVQGNILAEDSTVLVEAYSGTINLNNTSINSLLDVDTKTTSPTAGDVLKWDGSKWTAAAESGAAVSASNADLLDGFDGTYYLNYNNFTNTPTLAAVATSNNYNDLDNIPAAVSINLGYKQQIFTTSGSWTVPANVTSCKVFVIGGGGAGRVGYSGTNGAQGGWVQAYVTGLTSGSIITVTVGNGGAFQGGAGGTSSFGSYATGTGGQGVNGNPPNNRTGTGSVGSGATLLTTGNNNALVYLSSSSFQSQGFPDWLIGYLRGTARDATYGGGTNTSELTWSTTTNVYPGSGGASQNSSNGSGTYAGVKGAVIIEY